MRSGRRLVCIGCRAVDPPDTAFVEWREIKPKHGRHPAYALPSHTIAIYKHRACGEEMVKVWYNWSPPKKSNDRAWKRIAEGDWLWDHRRVRRIRNRPAYIVSYRSNGNVEMGA